MPTGSGSSVSSRTLSSELNTKFRIINIELFLSVARLTILHPMFSIFVPLMILGQGYKTYSTPFRVSSLYALITLTIHLFFWLDNAARNGFKHRRLDWDEEIVIITGGSGSLGSVLADTLAMRGVTVVVLDLVKPESQFHVEYYQCDVSNEDQVNQIAKEIIKDIGHPTILINNAGIANGQTLLDLDSEDIKRCFGVNLLASFWTIRAFLPHMIEKNHGHIVTISSASAWSGISYLSDYCASKSALQSLHESLRFEIAQSKGPMVRTTIVSPGLFHSPMFAGIKYSFIASFFAPVLEPITVVKKIIATLDSYESNDICLPTYSSLSGLGRFMPFSFVQLSHAILQSDTALVGRSMKKSQ